MADFRKPDSRKKMSANLEDNAQNVNALTGLYTGLFRSVSFVHSPALGDLSSVASVGVCASYATCGRKKIQFEGAHYRRDIAAKALRA
jgi:hypothetical protein